ncbi:hypothetical protein DL93DRAFT_2062893, partial [Clavulina sp. PMI_390]
GLSIIPAVVPTGTVLYHGRTDANIPAVPDWLAFDFEHAHVFVSATSGHVLTFATKRPLRVLAFDGLSAHMARDTQQMLIYGRVVEQGAPLDPQEELCEWARKHNIDGFMRAEIHFELIICDFGTTMELVSTLRVLPSEDMIKRGKPNASKINAQLPQGRDGPSSPGFGRPPPPAGWVGSLLTDYLTEVDLAAKRHDFAPGETRVRPLFSKFVTFYDPEVKSLIEGRRGQTRDHHRLLDIEKSDVEMMVKQLEEVVDDEVGWEEKSSASGVDWESILRVVIQRYGERLEFLNHTLATHRAVPFTRAFKSRQQVLTILAPYFTVYDIPANVSSMESKRAWLSPVVQRCTTTHTKGLPTHLFTKQEHLLYHGVQTVMREICRRMGRMFYMSYDIETIDPEKKTEETYSAIAEAMRVEISSLMEWLDWVQVWMKCRPSCAIDVSGVLLYEHQLSCSGLLPISPF